eukprot:TRINITY_DN11874_c0_g1_i1.p1 TRINITY_DN11874_c0_g1~~TRINITY_DN11874_c0_g1_i1.p1  ORF type:complete len:245 (+),score=40.09 TRINITY_DN11874_c0_g1_i1:17-751(+)
MELGKGKGGNLEVLTARTPNGFKISILLEELKVDCQYRNIALGQGEQKEDWFLKLNPNGRIPVLIDHTTGQSIFESGAIMIYLAEKYNKFYYTGDEPEQLTDDEIARRKYTVLQWLFFQMSGVGPMQGQAHVFFRYAAEKIPMAIERYQAETKRLYGVLDGQLAKTPYIAGHFVSIADFSLYPWVKVHFWAGVSIDDLPNLKNWLQRMGQREGVKKGMNIPPKPNGIQEAQLTLKIGQQLHSKL